MAFAAPVDPSKTLKSRVIYTDPLYPAALSWLGARTDAVLVPPNSKKFDDALAGAAGLIVRASARVDADLLDRASQLRVVGRTGVGLENVDLEECKRRKIRVVYTPHANTDAVTEYVWALILDSIRPRVTFDRFVDASAFHRMRLEPGGVQLNGLVLGVLGVGRIGRKVSRIGEAFGMKVVGHDLLTRDELGLDSDSSIRLVDAHTLYEESDILTIHIDARPENRRLINRGVLETIKRSCILINTSRGSVVDHAALARWARDAAATGGRAILDVHDPEPPGADYPLFGIANVLLLPHRASRTATAMADMSWVVRDVVAVLEGREPRWSAV